MYKATDGLTMPTTVTGSLPRPAWYTENLGRRSFIEAMVNSNFREQYTDAVSAYLRDQETAGLDICTDGDAHFDNEVGGYSWFSYAIQRMSGLDTAGAWRPAPANLGLAYKRGHILHDGLEARINPTIVGPVGRGTLQYTPMWKVAQRLTRKPIKFGTIVAELIGLAVRDTHYKSRRERILAIAEALNAELHELADAGCAAIQLEEPQIHLLAPRGGEDKEINQAFMVEVFNATVKGLRAKTEVWAHSCWGNPSQQRILAETPSYGHSLADYDRCDADVITFETCSSAGRDFEAIGKAINGKKVAVGVIDHHTLQVERPEEVAALVREAAKHIGPERLILSSDCGMGREGMSRRHAFYKMVALVQGTNIVRKELGLPEVECLAAEGRFSLTA
jgi:5-methyltetrahydropteroyltriglutamate--homocysteine methyltransferase